MDSAAWRWALCLAIAAGIAAASGCRHPTGYVDVRGVLTPVAGEGRIERTAFDMPLRLAAPVTNANPVLDLRVEELEIASGAALRERYGRATWVPWRWYAPVLKPVVAITLVGPLYLSAYSPHSHGEGNWRMRDYWRDVASWFNPFSAVPMGPRRVETTPRLLGIDELRLTHDERRLPVSGRRVTLYLNDAHAAETTSDADGAVRFDMASLLRPEHGAEDLRVRLSLDGETNDFVLTLPGDLVRRLLEKTGGTAPQ